MTRIPHQHQRWTRTERGNSWGMCAPILAADAMQGGTHVCPVGVKRRFVSRLSLTDLPTLQLAGVRSRLFSHSHRARVSSPRSVIARIPPARGGCLSSLSGSRQISSGGPGRGAFVAALAPRRFHTFPKISHNVLQDLADRSECHSLSLSVCGWRGNTQPQERGQNLGTVSRPESH